MGGRGGRQKTSRQCNHLMPQTARFCASTNKEAGYISQCARGGVQIHMAEPVYKVPIKMFLKTQ